MSCVVPFSFDDMLGLLLLVFSLTMLIPIIFALYYNEATTDIFLLAFTLTAFVGAILWLPNKKFV